MTPSEFRWLLSNFSTLFLLGFLIEKTIESYAKIKDDVELVIVSGPSLKKDYQKNIRNLGFVNNLHEIIFASDLIVSLGGKSTIDESKSYGTPGIFIPIKNHFEQENNANENKNILYCFIRFYFVYK